MQIRYLPALLALSVTCIIAFAADPQPGDTRDEVIKALGKPRGRVMLGDKEMLTYERGLVELNNGEVASVKLVSPNEVRAEREAQAEADRSAEAERQRRTEQAEQAKKDLLADGNLQTNSASEQVSRWNEYKQTYPDATLPEEYNIAVGTKRKDDQAAVAQIAPAEKKIYPKLSGSKRKKYRRAHNTNMVDIADADEIAEREQLR